MLRPIVDRLNRYRGVGAVRRAARAAVVMPAMFALGDKLIGNPVMATFAAFGSFAMVLLVEFGGSMRERTEAQIALAIVTGALICLGTLVSQNAWLAAAVMSLVAFCVLFAGVVSAVLASATTSLLLAFILPVTLTGNPATIPDRLAGWGLASAGALLAMRLLWPNAAQDPLRAAAANACRAMAERLRGDIVYHSSPITTDSTATHDDAIEQAAGAVKSLHGAFLATPYRPTGLSTSARMTVRLIDELNWLNVIYAHSLHIVGQMMPGSPSQAVKESAADVMSRSAELLDRQESSLTELRQCLAELESATAVMEQRAAVELPVGHSSSQTVAGDDDDVAEFVTSLDPSFRAQELSFVVALIGGNVERTVAAEQRGWWERVLGHQPDGSIGPFASAKDRAAAHLERHSVWLHNSLRGAAALALAVFIADKTGVQHSFWVVFGTLSVLRSNALNTGQNALRGVIGTAVGFAVGAALLTLIGTHITVLWCLLPIAVFFAGVAPALISFAVGQAAFTLTLLILYNIVQPAGWRLGLVRVEDVAIGCGVSLLVGLLFWPRGAGASLRVALAEAYDASARYLDGAVACGALRCDQARTNSAPPTAEASLAAAASRRLDDTFRNYLAERGHKPVSLAEMTTLVTGVAALRLAGDAVVGLWEHDDEPGGDRAAARQELRASSAVVRDWYGSLATSLLTMHQPELPLEHDMLADGRLIGAVRRDLNGADGASTATAVRVIWTADHLDAARRLQRTIIEPARSAAAG